MISNKNAANSFILGFSRLYRFHPPGDDFQVWFIYNISNQTNRKEPHTYVI